MPPGARPGRRPTITKEDVAKAIEELRANGGVSLKGVREVLGRGSFSTIGPLYRELMGAGQDGEPSGDALANLAEFAGLMKEKLLRNKKELEAAEADWGMAREALEAAIAENARLKTKVELLSETRMIITKLRERAVAAETIIDKARGKELGELKLESANLKSKLIRADATLSHLKNEFDSLDKKRIQGKAIRKKQNDDYSDLSLKLHKLRGNEADLAEKINAKRKERMSVEEEVMRGRAAVRAGIIAKWIGKEVSRIRGWMPPELYP